MDHAERASRLENWLRLYSSNGTLQTTVSDPKPSRSGGVTSAVFGPTTLFTVTTVSPNDDRKDMWSVERSMGDFTALRSALVSRFPGAVLAHLPESRMTDITKSKEEKTTKQGEILNHFLRFLCRHPFISQDQVFLAFLSVTSKFSDALKAVAPDAAPSSKFSLKMLGSSTRNRRRSLEKGTSTSNVSEGPVMAMDWWKEAIDLAAAPPDPLKLSKDVLSELERIKKRVSDLKSLIRDFKEKLKGVGTTCLDLNKAFQNWIAVEYYPDAVAVAAENGNEAAASNPAQGQPVPNADGMVMISMSMPVLLAENANRFHNQGLIHQRMALDAAATLLSAVREEILVLDALKQQVISARDAVQKVEDAKAHLAKREKELAMMEEQARLERGMGAVPGGSSDPMFANEGESSDPVFEKKTRTARRARDDAILALDSATVVASTLTRSTLNLELNFFREERIIRSDKFFTEFARVHSEYCAKSLEVWTMEPVHGLPHPPVPATALTASLTTSPVKDRVGRLQTAKSTLMKAGIYDSHLKEEETDDHTEDEEYRERNGSSVNGDQLIEWGPDIPWDPKVARLVQVAFDFDPEHDDELYGRQGDRGTAVPFDDERQWLHVKLENGRSGIIPTDFIRIVAASPRASDAKRKQKANKSSSFSDSINDDDENKSSARLEELEAELAAMKAENAKLKKDLADKDEFMSFRNEQLTEAEDQVAEFRAANKNLQLDLDRVTSERDRALNERDRAVNERDRALNERDQALSAVARAESRQQAQSARLSGEQQPKQPSPAASRQSIESVNSSAASASEDLPPNWVKVLDKQRNRYFYHNTVTKQSVWKKPEFHEIKASMPSTQGSKRKHGE